MKARLIFLFLLLVGMLVSLTFGQNNQSSDDSSRANILARTVEGNDLEYLSTVHAFSKALQKSGTPGGAIYLSNCQENPINQRWQPLRASLQDVLDWIVKADPSYRWGLNNGVVNLTPTAKEPEMLKTRIGKFHVKDAASVDAALSKLLTTMEVKEAVAKLGLNESLKIIIRPIPLNSKKKMFNVHCKDVTLREALNAIARAEGKAIWSYRETHCNGKNEFSIDFIVQ